MITIRLQIGKGGDDAKTGQGIATMTREVVPVITQIVTNDALHLSTEKL